MPVPTATGNLRHLSERGASPTQHPHPPQHTNHTPSPPCTLTLSARARYRQHGPHTVRAGSLSPTRPALHPLRTHPNTATITQSSPPLAHPPWRPDPTTTSPGSTSGSFAGSTEANMGPSSAPIPPATPSPSRTGRLATSSAPSASSLTSPRPPTTPPPSGPYPPPHTASSRDLPSTAHQDHPLVAPFPFTHPGGTSARTRGQVPGTP